MRHLIRVTRYLTSKIVESIDTVELGKFVHYIESSLYRTPRFNEFSKKQPKCSLYREYNLQNAAFPDLRHQNLKNRQTKLFPLPSMATVRTNFILFCLFGIYLLSRLRVVPHFSSGIVERGKRERAWKSPHAAEGDTRREERKKSFFFLPAACRLFSRGVFFTPARVSLALLSLRKNGGLLVVYLLSHVDIYSFPSLYYPWGKWGTTRSLSFITQTFIRYIAIH